MDYSFINKPRLFWRTTFTFHLITLQVVTRVTFAYWNARDEHDHCLQHLVRVLLMLTTPTRWSVTTSISMLGRCATKSSQLRAVSLVQTTSNTLKSRHAHAYKAKPLIVPRPDGPNYMIVQHLLQGKYKNYIEHKLCADQWFASVRIWGGSTGRGVQPI